MAALIMPGIAVTQLACSSASASLSSSRPWWSGSKARVPWSCPTRADLSVTVATVLFFQFISGEIGISAAANIMNNVIINSLPAANPNISPTAVLAAGPTGLRDAFPNPDSLAIFVDAYMRGLKAAWMWSIALLGLAFFISFGAEWKSVKPEDVKERIEWKAAVVAAGP